MGWILSVVYIHPKLRKDYMRNFFALILLIMMVACNKKDNNVPPGNNPPPPPPGSTLNLTLDSSKFQFLSLVVPVVILKLLSPFLLIHPAYDLHRDEYLHLDQGLHLAWGYISVPPVTSWMAWIIHQLGRRQGG